MSTPSTSSSSRPLSLFERISKSLNSAVHPFESETALPVRTFPRLSFLDNAVEDQFQVDFREQTRKPVRLNNRLIFIGNLCIAAMHMGLWRQYWIHLVVILLVIPFVCNVIFEIATWVDKLYRHITVLKVGLLISIGTCWVVAAQPTVEDTDDILLPPIYFASSVGLALLHIPHPYGLLALVCAVASQSIVVGTYYSTSYFPVTLVGIAETFTMMLTQWWFVVQSEVTTRQLWAMNERLHKENIEIRNELEYITSVKQEVLDLESPLQKVISVLASLKSLAYNQFKEVSLDIWQEFYSKLSFSIRSLSTENFLLPDFKQQIEEGGVIIDPETKNWLFTEVAGRQVAFCARHDATDRSQPSPALQKKSTFRSISEWGVDIIKFSATLTTPLQTISESILEHHNYLEAFGLSTQSIVSFLSKCEDSYQNNCYHNSIHASDVVQTVNCFLELGVQGWLSDIERFALIIAAAAHDVGHPGLSNNFLNETESSLSLVYNDKSVLENHHASTACRFMKESGFDELMTREDFKRLRKLVIEMILATDMTYHFDWVNKFKLKKDLLDKEKGEDRLLLLCVALKCADISNVCKPASVYRAWTTNLLTEFYSQGDKERTLGMTISPFMDRERPETFAQSQKGFFQFIAEPLIVPFLQFLSSSSTNILAIFQDNMKSWESQLSES